MKTPLRQLTLLVIAFAFGSLIGIITSHNSPLSAGASAAASNWGLSYPEKGKTPVGNASSEKLSSFNTHYVGNSQTKTVYLTFDAGYENGNTAPILDALKKHNVPAVFFVVGTYIENNPELVKRMVSEGHLVGNHTYSHPDMSKIASFDAFEKELKDVELLYETLIGTPMPKLYRPPQGIYSELNLSMAQKLGYHTFFWSLAYVDWYQDKQPSKEEAFEKLLGRIHPGAIILLHSTSSTNAAILDEYLFRLKEMGYNFGTLEEFITS